MATYSLTKDPSAKRLKPVKSAVTKVTVTKNPGNTKAFISKDTSGTAVAIVKGS